MGAKYYYFGASDRPLMGSLHHPKRLRTRSSAVLLCNPMGAEAMHAHRLYRVLAEQLEQAGFTVLRFDYGGSGDSGGGSECVSVSSWLNDILTAAGELGAVTSGKRLVIVGLRMGATLAALASSRLSLRARQIVMWDPVIDGLNHLHDLAAAHRAFMRAELGADAWRDKLEVDADGVPRESLGTSFSAAMLGELRGLDLAAELPKADHVMVVSTQSGSSVARFREALDGRSGLRWTDMPASENWNSDAALNAATVPMELIREITAGIQEVNP